MLNLTFKHTVSAIVRIHIVQFEWISVIYLKNVLAKSLQVIDNTQTN